MSTFFISSPIMPIYVTRRRPTESRQRRISEESIHSSTNVADQKSLKTQATASSKDSAGSSKSQSRRQRLRRFLNFRKNAEYEKIEESKAKKPEKPVKKYQPNPYDHYYGMAYGPWF